MNPKLGGRGIGAPAAAGVALAVVGLLLVEGLVVFGLGSIPIVQVSVTSHAVPPTGLETTFDLSVGLHPLVVHVGLVPGSVLSNSDPTVLLFADPQYRPLYASFNDVYGLAVRLASYLTLEHSALHVDVVDATTLPGMLTQHPHSYLVIAGTGIIPDFLFSTYSNQLPQWIRAGGVLIWAGGPLGYVEGHPDPTVSGGFVYESLDWAGQVRLVGFDLTDPWAPSPTGAGRGLPSSNTSYSDAYAEALGIQYSASPAGANLSTLGGRGGVAIGYPGSSPNGSSPRTSLAWVPVGAGGVFFFGGAVFAPTYGAVPQASVSLAEDIGLLLSLRLRPQSGVVAYDDISLAAGERTSVTLQIPNASAGAVAVVHSEFQGSVLFFWGSSFPPASSSLGSTPLLGAGPPSVPGNPSPRRSR